MKTVALRRARQTLSGVVAHAQRERVLITKHGKPAALMIGVEGQEFEDVRLSQDTAFWKLVEERRREPTISLTEVRAGFGVHPKAARRRRRTKAAPRNPSGR